MKELSIENRDSETEQRGFEKRCEVVLAAGLDIGVAMKSLKATDMATVWKLLSAKKAVKKLNLIEAVKAEHLANLPIDGWPEHARRIAAYCQRKGPNRIEFELSTREAASVGGVTPMEAWRAIQALMRDGWLKRKGKGKAFGEGVKARPARYIWMGEDYEESVF